MARHSLVDLLGQAVASFSDPRTILVAVSGGADSMALLRGLLELRSEMRLKLHAAHLDHQLRGAAARADADWLAGKCLNFDIPLTIGRVDVAAAAGASGRGIEETARDERYTFLGQTARDHGCRLIALAHTADDQCETILHHVLRGTGLAGLRGMPQQRELASGIQLVRPLLAADRSKVIDYLHELGQDFRVDESNLDESYTRNRIRHNLLPLLAADYNPEVREALRRLGRQAADIQSAWEELAASLLERVLESASRDECRLKWQPLIGTPRHLVREVLALLWRRQDWSRQSMGFDQWDELARIALDGGTATLPARIEARREGRWLVIRRPTPQVSS
jgi:tRNA(Ile)-lysidine synthase